jgi:hypothetical protein
MALKPPVISRAEINASYLTVSKSGFSRPSSSEMTVPHS